MPGSLKKDITIAQKPNTSNSGVPQSHLGSAREEEQNPFRKSSSTIRKEQVLDPLCMNQWICDIEEITSKEHNTSKHIKQNSF